VFVDPEPRADFLRLKLGDKGYSAVRKDVRDLPACSKRSRRTAPRPWCTRRG